MRNGTARKRMHSSHGFAVTAPVAVPEILCSQFAHRISTAATPFCSLTLPQAALANVPDGPISFVCPKEIGERKRQQGEGFLPDALPLHPFLLALRSVRPHIWAGCIRPPPLPDACFCTASLNVASNPLSLRRAQTAPLEASRGAFLVRCSTQSLPFGRRGGAERQ